MFLRETWYVAAFAEEVGRTPLVRTLLGEQVMLYRGVDGAPRAINDICPHRFASLSQGRLDGDIVVCPYHGLRFNAAGECVLNPHGEGTIAPNAKVAAYPVAQRFECVWIWLGDAAKADPDLIPDLPELVRSDVAYFQNRIGVQANYQLIVDNLLDLSHIQFLHPFLSSSEWVERVETRVRQDDGAVYGTNFAADIETFPVWQAVAPEVPARGDHRMDVCWRTPSTVSIDIRFEAQDISLEAPGAHFITPETAASSHYFYRIGRNSRTDEPELTRQMAAATNHAFSNEDGPMIEQQQRNIGDADLFDLRPLILNSDACAVRARRILSQKISREAEQKQLVSA